MRPICCLVVLLVLAATPASADDAILVERIVAVVHRTPILESDLQARAERLKAPRREALEQMIDEILIAREAERLQVRITDAEVDRAVDMIQQTNGIDRAALVKALREAGYTMASYRKEVHHQLLRQRLIQLELRDQIQGATDAERAQSMAAAAEVWLEELRARAYVEIVAPEAP